MSDPKFPGPPRLPTIPPVKAGGVEGFGSIADTQPPAEQDPIEMMAELKAALVNCGDLMMRLTTRLSRLQLAMLAAEHKANTVIDRTDDMAHRLGKVESFLGLAAE